MDMATRGKPVRVPVPAPRPDGLLEMRIQGLGVIEDAVLELGPGLTVVTGETGAGKTMVVQGLALLLGAKPDVGMIRNGAERAVVETVTHARTHETHRERHDGLGTRHGGRHCLREDGRWRAGGGLLAGR